MTKELVEVVQADRDAADRCPIERVWSRIDMEAEAFRLGEDGDDQSYRVGLRDGFSEAIRLLDMLTGGDGEYRFCTVPDERHCPTPVEMGRRIVARLSAEAAIVAWLREQSAKAESEGRSIALWEAADTLEQGNIRHG